MYKLLSLLLNWIFPTKELRQRFRGICKEAQILCKDKKGYNSLKKNYLKKISDLKRKYKDNKKIRVLFLVRENSKWTYDFLYKKMQESEIFDPIIAVSILETIADSETGKKFLNTNYQFFKNLGYNVKKAFDEDNNTFIDLSTFEPDIIFYDQPWELPVIHKPVNVSKYALTMYSGYSFYIAYNTMVYINEFHKLLFKNFLPTDLHLEYVKEVNPSCVENTKIVGYPKMDVFLENNDIDLSKYWKNPEKFKIIYAPHHSFELNRLRLATFEQNGKFILELAKSHPETTWIFKPHPRFKFALLKNNIMTEEEIERYYNEWANLGNIHEQGNYIDIFKSSDLLITDCSSFLAEYLPTKKPVIRLSRLDSEKLNIVGQQISKNYYLTYNNSALGQIFNEIVVKKNDFMKEERIEVCKKIFDFTISSTDKIIAEILEIIKDI